MLETILLGTVLSTWEEITNQRAVIPITREDGWRQLISTRTARGKQPCLRQGGHHTPPQNGRRQPQHSLLTVWEDTGVSSIAGLFWEQREEGIQLLGETGEVTDRLWGRELELKFQFQPKWQSLTPSVKVPTAGDAGSGEISKAGVCCSLLSFVQNKHLSASSTQQVLPCLPDVPLGIPALSSFPNHYLRIFTR